MKILVIGVTCYPRVFTAHGVPMNNAAVVAIGIASTVAAIGLPLLFWHAVR